MRIPSPARHPRAARRDDLTFRLLRALDATPGLSQRDLAQAVGVSLGGAHGLLNGLIANRLVTLAAPEGAAPARLRFDYVLSPEGRAEMDRLAAPYLSRRVAERQALDAEISALEALGARGAGKAGD